MSGSKTSKSCRTDPDYTDVLKIQEVNKHEY